MKRIKKIICFLMCLITVICMIPAVNAANKGSVDSAEWDKDFVSLSLTKPANKVYDNAEVTVKISNNKAETINNVIVCVSPQSKEFLAPKGSETKFYVADSINKGEAKELTFKVLLDSKAGGANFFEKIIMFFKRLFRKPSVFEHVENMEQENLNYGPFSASTAVTFGKVEKELVIQVYFLYGLTDTLENIVDDVDSDISDLLNSDEFKEAYFKVNNPKSTASLNKSRAAESTDLENLEKIVNNGLKSIDNISDYFYDEKSNLFWFRYALPEFLEPWACLPLVKDENTNSVGNNITPSELPLEIMTANADEGDGTGILFLENFSDPNSKYTQKCDELQEKGVNANHISTPCFKDVLNLGKYEIVVFSCHGDVFRYNEYKKSEYWRQSSKAKPFDDSPYIIVNAGDTSSTSKEYDSAFINFQICPILTPWLLLYKSEEGICGIMPSFFTDLYSKTESGKNCNLNDSVVIMENCYGFENQKLADALKQAGCVSVIGFTGAVYGEYSRKFAFGYIDSLLDILSVKDAADTVKLNLNNSGLNPGKDCEMKYSSDRENYALNLSPISYKVYNKLGDEEQGGKGLISSGTICLHPGTSVKTYDDMIKYVKTYLQSNKEYNMDYSVAYCNSEDMDISSKKYTVEIYLNQ